MDGETDRHGWRTLLPTLAALAVFALGALCSWQSAQAATLYMSEFANGVSIVNSTQPPIPPQPSIADQTVALSGSSAQSSAFNAATRAVLVVCDAACSILFGANPTAATTNLRLPANVPFMFGVVPGQKLAAISNP